MLFVHVTAFSKAINRFEHTVGTYTYRVLIDYGFGEPLLSCPCLLPTCQIDSSGLNFMELNHASLYHRRVFLKIQSYHLSYFIPVGH